MVRMMQVLVVVIAMMMAMLPGMAFLGNCVLVGKVMMRLIMVKSKVKVL